MAWSGIYLIIYFNIQIIKILQHDNKSLYKVNFFCDPSQYIIYFIIYSVYLYSTSLKHWNEININEIDYKLNKNLEKAIYFANIKY